MTEISEAKQSPAPGRKKVFIPCIHRPGFDSLVPNPLIHQDGKGYWKSYSDYNLQRNWPLLKIIGCFESKQEARAAVDVSFYAMKNEGVIDPRASLFKMRRQSYPFVASQEDDFSDLDDDVDTSGDERMTFRSACKLVKKGPTLWSIFPFDMLLTECALSEVFVASGQYNWSCCCAGGDEEIEIFGVFQGANEARTALDNQKKQMEAQLLHDCDESEEDDESEEEDVPSPPKEGVPLSPKKFPSTLLVPDKDNTENWHPDGTGCILFQVRVYDAHADCGVDRVSLRVQKVPNVPASMPMTLLALVKSFRDTLVWLQLCNKQGIALFPFVRLPPRVRRPFAGSRVYDMLLTHAERLRVVGCGVKGELVRLLSLGMGRHCEPQGNSSVSRKMMQGIARRVAAGLAATVQSKSESKKRARRDRP